MNREGALTLQLDFGDDVVVAEGGLPNDGRLTVQLAATDVFRLAIQPIVLTNGTAPGAEEVRLTEDQIAQAITSIRQLFPVPDVKVTRLPERRANGLSITASRDVGRLSQELNQQREQDIANASTSEAAALKQTYYLALVPRETTIGQSTHDFTAGVAANESTGAAHELAHCLRRDHATDAALIPEKIDPSGLPTRRGHCGETANGAVEPFPYFFASPGQTAIRPRIGPLSRGAQRVVFGFDPDAMRPLDPRVRTELMGYCDISNHWISELTYKALFTELRGRRQLASPAPAFEDGIQSVTSVLSIEGVISTPLPGEIYSCIATVAEPTVPPDASPWMLRLLGAGGATLAEQRVALLGTGSDGSFGYFEARIPTPASPVAAVQLLENEVVVDTLSAGVQPPTVSNVSLTSNGGGAFTLNWTATDLDGDSLKSMVSASYDAGTSWTVLSGAIDGTNFPIPVAEMRAGTGVRFRVIASDGIRISAPVQAAGSIVIANHAPLVSILNPAPAETVPAAKSLRLSAEVFDLETDASALVVTWSSDVAGTLGTGRELVLPPFALAAGAHLIQASVRDAGGLVTLASLSIVVTAPELPELTSLEADDDGSLNLFITAPNDRRIQTEVSTDLQEWVPIDVRVFGTGTGVIESSVLGIPARFYRWSVLPNLDD